MYIAYSVVLQVCSQASDVDSVVLQVCSQASEVCSVISVSYTHLTLPTILRV